MPRKTGLGRGLDALIPGSETPPGTSIREIPVDQIAPNPRQPRTGFDPDELTELADSIRTHGVIQPLIVTQGRSSDQFTLIAGERRLLAARQVNLQRVPVIIRQVDEMERLEIALIENLQRSDLNPLEAAEAFRQLVEDFNFSHEQIADRVGKSRVSITNTLRLLKLSQAVQKALSDGTISEGHARALLALENQQGQALALETIQAHELNVRQTETLVRLVINHSPRLLELTHLAQRALAEKRISAEQALMLLQLASPQAQDNALQVILSQNLNDAQSEALIRRLAGEKPSLRSQPAPSPEIQDLETRLRSVLGFPVNLRPRRKGGTITIQYYSDEDLNTIIDHFFGDV